MVNNATLVRWLAPICLFILLLILVLAVTFTSPARTLDLPTVATAVNQVNQTATAGASTKNQPTRVPAQPTTGKQLTPAKSPTSR
ncbi:MAG TPA: hypothetical protein VF458_15995 [Ktedonobacteraceae bacterium]